MEIEHKRHARRAVVGRRCPNAREGNRPERLKLSYRRVVGVRRAARTMAQGALLLLLSGAARAEDSLAASNARFDDGKRLLNGKRLLKEGKVAEACAAFAESQRLAPRAGTLLNLGLCHEQEGKLIDARRELIEARALAQSANNQARVTLASQHLTAIEAKLSWLELVPPPNVDQGLVTLSVDGVALEKTGWQKVPVEAGRHVVSAAAPGFARQDLELSIGQKPERRSVSFEALAPETAPATAPATPPRRQLPPRQPASGLCQHNP